MYSAQVLQSIGCEGILRLLDSERSAHFLTVAVLWTGEVVEVFIGRCDGEIAMECRGDGGFGYDPIFIPFTDDEDLTFAEMTSEEKSACSHRGRALRALYDYLNENGA